MAIGDPTQWIYLQGYLNNDPAHSTYTRLTAKGNTATNVMFLTPTDAGAFKAGTLADFFVPISTAFYFDGYPPLSSSPVVPVVPLHPLGGRFRPPPPPASGFVGSDGTALVVQRDAAGAVTELSATSKDGYDYSLVPDIVAGSAVMPERQSKAAAPWLWAKMSITKTQVGSNTVDQPLTWAFSYCPFGALFTVSLFRGTVTTGVIADLSAGLPGGPGAPEVSYIRTISCDNYTFSITPEVSTPLSQQPPLYPVGGAALWSFLDRISYFSPALQTLADAISPTPAPIVALLKFNWTSTTLSEFLLTNTPIVQQSIASCAAAVAGDAAELASASLWLGSLLREGTGLNALTQMLTATFQAWMALPAAERTGVARGGGPKIAKIKPVTTQNTDDVFGNTVFKGD